MTIHSELNEEQLLEKYAHISDNHLINNFINTQKESDAYNKLADGFSILAKLPETEESNKRLFSVRSDGYYLSRDACLDFLELLVRLAEARKLNMIIFKI